MKNFMADSGPKDYLRISSRREWYVQIVVAAVILLVWWVA